MSESELSEASRTPAPPDHELEKALRREVIKAQKDEVDFSLKYIRTAAETKLGLTPGFYKTHPVWNQRSKDTVQRLVRAKDLRDCAFALTVLVAYRTRTTKFPSETQSRRTEEVHEAQV